MLDISRKHTDGEYKKLRKRILESQNPVTKEDCEILQDLRISYKDPLKDVYNAIDKLAHNINKNCICTYRIKRIESIISKIRRNPTMKVQRIADIAGCRCIMPNLADTYKLYNKILNEQNRLPFEIQGTPNDYISNPKPDGYKSIHLNVKLKDGNTQFVEIQLRSITEHNWATLVEISDLVYGSKLKEFGDKVDPELYRFHQILSKSDEQLSRKDIKELVQISYKKKYLKRIGEIFSNNSLEQRKRWNEMKLNKKSFFLISASSEGKPEFEGFENFDDAEDAYFNSFSKNLENEESRNIVLTHLHSCEFAKISVAYSNYFLTYNAILFRILELVALASVNAFNKYFSTDFKKTYNSFWGIIYSWYGEKLKEIELFSEDVNIKKSTKKYHEWSNSIFNSIDRVNYIIDYINRECNTSTHPIHKHQKDIIDKKVEQKIRELKNSHK